MSDSKRSQEKTSNKKDSAGKHALHTSNPGVDRSPTRLENVARALGLGLFYRIILQSFRKTKGHDHELPKIGIHYDYKLALLTLLIHAVPVAVCLVLLYFNIKGFYIGYILSGIPGEDSLKQNLLQISAKIHELTMQASLSAIVFFFVRRKLAIGQSVYLGAIFAGLQFSNISFLWSKELFGMLKSSVRGPSKKPSLVAVIILATLLGSSVGPSSAILMIPRLDNWDAGGSDFWLGGTLDDIAPSLFEVFPGMISCSNYTEAFGCPTYTGWESIASFASQWNSHNMWDGMPSQFLIEDDINTRTMYVNTNLSRFPRTPTVASTQLDWAADGLVRNGPPWISATWSQANINNRFHYRQTGDWRVEEVPQPVSYVPNGDNAVAVIESMLATMMALGLTNLSPSEDVYIQGKFKSDPGLAKTDCDIWCSELMPQGKLRFGGGGQAWNLTGTRPNKTKFTFKVTINGYGFDSRPATTKFAIVILIIYCIFVFVHIVFAAPSGISSTSWDSVSEVTVLAVQSPPTPLLANTSAGISTSRVFATQVRIVGNRVDNHLEMVFGEDGLAGRSPIVRNRFYN
ncbi:hypothetical protein MMC11_006070 [Xylographa trunciseda]|nr:hypothetical protein [Xylographa trunciseda]